MSFVDLSNFYLNSAAVMQGQKGAPAEAASQETNATTGANAPVADSQPGGLFGGGMFSIILIYGVIIGGFYFLSIRPQRKRQKQVQQMQETLKVGDDVVTSTGMYGKVADITPDKFIIEFGTNKGIRIPVRKSDVFAAGSAPADDGKKSD